MLTLYWNSKFLPPLQNIYTLYRILDNAMDYLVLDLQPFLLKFFKVFHSYNQLVHSYLKLYIHVGVFNWMNIYLKQFIVILFFSVPDTTPESNNTRKQKIVSFIILLLAGISLTVYCTVLRILSFIFLKYTSVTSAIFFYTLFKCNALP